MGRVCFRLWLQVCLIAGSCIEALAADSSQRDVSGIGGQGAYSLQILGYLVVILVLLGAGVVVLTKGGFLGGVRSVGKAVRKLQIEESKMLGHRQYLVVAEYSGRRMLLGICPGRIDYLCPLDWEEGEGTSPKEVFPNMGQLEREETQDSK